MLREMLQDIFNDTNITVTLIFWLEQIDYYYEVNNEE